MAERGQEPRSGRARGRGNEAGEPVSEDRPTAGTEDAGATAADARRERTAREPGERAARAARVGPPHRATTAQPRPERYLIAPAPDVTALPGTPLGGPVGGPGLIEALGKDQEVRVLRVVRSVEQESPPCGLAGIGQAPPIAVVEMAPDRAMALAVRPDVYVDADQLLRRGEPTPPTSPIDAATGTLGEHLPVTFQVRDERGAPLRDAVVLVLGGLFPAAGTTGPDGTIEVPVPVDTLDAVRGVYVQPRVDNWSSWLGRPLLSATEPTTVVCRRLAAELRDRPIDNWANQAMGFDRLPPTYRGHGVKIAVIGSGIDATHPDLVDRVTGGLDVVGHDEKSWGEDVVGRTTHHVGLIAGLDTDSGIVGVAPDAEIHVCRVLPGGRFGDLIEALDYCIAHEIDVVSIEVGSEHSAGLVVQKIEQARQAGILCVAAAGDLGGPVLFPGVLPTVLTVAAIGKLGTYPADSRHATEVQGLPTPDGYFAARFSCRGPHVDVSAPGVAAVSAAAPNGYAAQDGTGVAAAYVTALAGLVLAHNPDFRYSFRARGAARVDHLAYLIKASCRPLHGADPRYWGAGIPDAVLAVGSLPQLSYPDFATQQMAVLGSAMYAAGIAPPGMTQPGMTQPGMTQPGMTTAGAAPAGADLPLGTRPRAGAGRPAQAARPPEQTPHRAARPAPPDTTLAALAAAMRAAGLLIPEPEG